MRSVDDLHQVGRSGRRWILAAGLLYSLTFQKYLLRDSLSQSVGLQGVLECSLTLLVCLIVVVQSKGARTRIGMHSSVLLFTLYGILCLASSSNSYDFKLSVVKGLLFFAVLVTAYLCAELQMSMIFLDGVYAGYLTTLVAALGIAAAFPARYPLFTVDSFNGRTRLALLATHPNALGEVSGLLFLLAHVLPIRSKWYSQGFLLIISILAGERTATGALMLSMCLVLLFGRRVTLGRQAVMVVAATLVCTAAIMFQVGMVPRSMGMSAGRAAESIYGTQTSSELSSLDGRADVWRKGAELASRSIVLGYGFEGARESLMSGVAWSGHAHNGFLQAALSSGVLGMILLIGGWYAAVKEMFAGTWTWKVKVLGVNLYLFLLAMIGPIFDSSSYFTIFLLVALAYSVLVKAGAWNTDRPDSRLKPEVRLNFAR